MFWRNYRPAIIWAFVVLILCGIPGDKFPELTFLEWLKPDKISHLILFGVQCFLLLKGYSKQTGNFSISKNASWLAVTISIFYGCLVEIMQHYIFVHRSGDVRDAVANAIGAFLGLWAYNYYLKKKIVRKT